MGSVDSESDHRSIPTSHRLPDRRAHRGALRARRTESDRRDLTVHVRPREARRDKPKVSGFTSARIEKFINLEPDLVVGFSDIQADIARELIKAGIEVWISNHRTVEGILGYVRRLGAMIGAAQAANALAAKLTEHLDSVAKQAASLPARPRVYFEEWDDPMISGIGWVSEIIEIAGGTDIFADHA